MENAKSKVSTEYDGKRRILYEKQCAVCGNAFWVPKHCFATAATCSATCRGKSQQTKILVSLTCANCKREFERSSSKLANAKHGHYFCSRMCKDTAQRLTGSCPDIRPSHYGLGNGKHSYRSTQLNIDSNCRCGENRTYLLTVHHRDGNRENNDIANLETVCFNCHALRHLKRDSKGNWKVSFASLTSKEDLEILQNIGDMV